MSISVTFEQGTGFSPRIVRIVTNSTLSQVTAAGWYKNLPPNQLQPSDQVEIAYAQGTSAAATSMFNVAIAAGVVTLSVGETSVVLPTIANHIATYTNVSGTLSEDPATAISGGNIQAGLSGTAGYLASFPGTAAKGSFRIVAVANTGDTLVTLSNLAHGQASVYSIPDSGAATANFIVSKLTGTQHITVGSLAVDAGSLTAGIATGGTAGGLTLFPATASNGSFVLTPVGNAGNFALTVSPKSTLGQASTITIPDPGAATANFVLDAGTAASVTATTGTFTNLLYGATPVAQVDPASCTITAAAGAANTSTITVQLKDGSGTNMSRSIFFRVYSSSASNGLTLQSAASTGYSVASGGLSLANGAAITTQISAMSSATGGCVLSLLDTAKLTSYLVLVLPNGNKISAQLSAGSYG